MLSYVFKGTLPLYLVWYTTQSSYCMQRIQSFYEYHVLGDKRLGITVDYVRRMLFVVGKCLRTYDLTPYIVRRTNTSAICHFIPWFGLITK